LANGLPTNKHIQDQRNQPRSHGRLELRFSQAAASTWAPSFWIAAQLRALNIGGSHVESTFPGLSGRKPAWSRSRTDGHALRVERSADNLHWNLVPEH
jgi:hypothetical protein